ncbi:hypothetical protein [Teichococcus deserti]|uniref:hypothetical protein n=1 Tax=Teichococcus deserti TaxID=1817963 RepID=UPI0009F81705|nr:hypothetical protein [Pseudoroseomonas deserti]
MKAATTAGVVVVASRLAERFGPFWGALIAALPVSAGPAYVFLALQHDAAFLAGSALGSYAANAATALFLLAYARLATRFGLAGSLGLALLAWGAAAGMIGSITWTPLTATLLNVAGFALGFAALRNLPPAPPAPMAPLRRKRDLPLRAATVAAFVVLVVLASRALGPQATGMAAVFPISLSSLIVILRPRIGAAASTLLAGSALKAMIGFGLMLLVLHLALPRIGVAPAMLLGLAVQLAWSLALLARQRRNARG